MNLRNLAIWGVIAIAVLVVFGVMQGQRQGAATPQEMLTTLGVPAEVLQLVQQRINLLRDSYVGTAGHKRPGVAKGLPVADAEQQAKELTARIEKLVSAGK